MFGYMKSKFILLTNLALIKNDSNQVNDPITCLIVNIMIEYFRTGEKTYSFGL